MLDLLPFFATHKYNTNGIAAFGGGIFIFLFFFCSLQLEEQRVAHHKKCYYNKNICVINNAEMIDYDRIMDNGRIRKRCGSCRDFNDAEKLSHGVELT